jgi:Fe-S-cluster containining protein
MLPEYQKILQQSKLKSAENKKFYERLKKLSPKDLDKVTNQLNDEAFEKIDCLQCANCCKTTGPLLKDKDIDRLADEMKLKPSQFTEKYLRIDEDYDYVFKQMPCPFLGDDKFCSVYKNRPGACRDYPHTHQNKMHNKLAITYLNSLICPAVAIVTEGLKLKYQPNKQIK